MKNSNINFNRTLEALEREIKKKFTKFRYVIDSKIEQYEYIDFHDEDEYIPFSELKVFYPDKPCYLGDILKLKGTTQYYNPGIKEALTHVVHLVGLLRFDESISFFLNLRPAQKGTYHRLEVSYFQETKILSVLLVKTLCFGYLSPKKGVVVMKDF